MPGKAKYLFIASMDVDPAKEALFNEVYDTEHIPLILVCKEKKRRTSRIKKMIQDKPR